MTRERQKTHYGRIVVLALLLGLCIQGLLGYVASRRQAVAAAQILRELGSVGRSAAAAELGDRAARWAAAEPRLARLPRERRAAAEAADPSLLILVNRWNPLPEGYEPELEIVARDVDRDFALDRRCAEAFLRMLEDCRAAGGKPIVCSAYRTQLQQQALFQDKIRRLLEEGVSWEEAPELAGNTVAVPGTSEHQLGLAVDIIDEDYPYLDEKQEQTFTQQWLMENAWRYGFILRYPNGTTDVTGIIYEPWHYRYVGTAYAAEIFRLGLPLEQYLELREGRA